MRKAIVVLISAMLIVPLLLAQNDKTQAAEKSADNWLAMVDKGDYAASWDQTAAMFKSAVTKDKWAEMLRATRAPLGKVISRKLQTAQYTTTLPGAPDGEYVVIQYETSFENKKSAIETIVPTLDKDGQWRVGGYFIK